LYILGRRLVRRRSLKLGRRARLSLSLRLRVRLDRVDVHRIVVRRISNDITVGLKARPNGRSGLVVRRGVARDRSRGCSCVVHGFRLLPRGIVLLDCT
jgi:hypothetical protein